MEDFKNTHDYNQKNNRPELAYGEEPDTSDKKFWEKKPEDLSRSDLRLMSRAISAGWLKQGVDGFSTMIPQMQAIIDNPLVCDRVKVRAADVLIRIFNSSLNAMELEERLTRLDEGTPTENQGITFVIKEADNTDD